MVEQQQGDVAILVRNRTRITEQLNTIPSPVAKDTVGFTNPLNASVANSAVVSYDYSQFKFGNVSGKLANGGSGAGYAKLLDATTASLQVFPGTRYCLSLYVLSPTQGTANPRLRFIGPGFDTYAGVSATKGQWIRYWTSAVPNASGSFQVVLDFDSAQTTATLNFDGLQLDAGVADPLPMVYGSLPQNGDSIYRYQGSTGFSISEKFHYDPSEVKYPLMILGGHHQGKDNGNIIHRTLSNSLFVSRRPATKSIGSLRAFFTSRQAAYELYSLLDRSDDFQLIDNANPESGMFFSVDGRILIDQDTEQLVPDTGENPWVVTVPYQQTA